MTSPHDDVDSYLTSGDEISNVYKSRTQTAPAKLDAAVLDYARNAVSNKNSKTSSLWWPMAMAASVILGIVAIRTFQHPATEQTPQVTSTDTTVTAKTAPQTLPADNSQQKDEAVANVAPEKSPQPSAAQPVQQAESKQAVSVKEKTDKKVEKKQAVAASPTVKKETNLATKAANDNPLLAPVKSSIGEAEASEIESWYKKIEKLFAENKTAEAKSELAEFLKKHPQHEAALKLKKQYLPD